ncbi:hypothetical protein [uncultured Lactobacillus sp.]|uniref:hypothetical protein n=1 Tax=uncultured Lactobacillus sp. TaxID=153152 RepID=UPI0026028224|nr:hypothetical protein [uncultured Lactobacillus sp.]
MRRVLSNLGDQDRHTFRAQFGKYGYKRFHDPIRGELYSATMVVRNVEIVDNPDRPTGVTDHLWLNLTKGFSDLGLLQPGDVIEFNGRVAAYTKGYGSTSIQDYKLTYPSKIKLLTDRKTQAIPQDHTALIGMIMNLNYDFYKKQARPLVPFFMDGFKKWQDQQTNPLPIECHQGNDYESELGYDALNFEEEMKSWQAKKEASQARETQNSQDGIILLKKNKQWLESLLELANENNGNVSNRVLTDLLAKEISDKDELNSIRVKIKAAIKSDWFKDQLESDNSNLSHLELLDKKLNSR